MEILIADKGRTPCGSSCPYYEESGEVHCIGGSKKSHCRLIMQPFWVDCNVFDVRTLHRMSVSDSQWRCMQQAAGKTARPVRKPWKRDHKEIHHIGTNTRAKK